MKSTNAILWLVYAAIVVSTWMICKRLDKLIELCTIEDEPPIQLIWEPDDSLKDM